ncbi:MAG: PAS domain S-box protein [Pyrinomonadaceae bacterium]
MKMRLPQNALFPYGLSFVPVALALFITDRFEILRGRTPVYFFAVIGMTWFFGRSVGLFTLFASAVAAAYFTLAPYYSFDLAETEAIQLTTFVVVTLPMILLVSALKRRGDALADSEQRYRTLFEYAPEGIIISDPKSVFLEANASICKMLGYSREEFVGLRAADILSKEDRSDLKDDLNVLQPGKDHRKVMKFRRRDGTIVPVEVIATTMPDGNLLDVIRDLSEREQAEERFRQMIEKAQYGKILVNASGEITLVNAEIERCFGYERSELIGKKVEILVPERFRFAHPGHREKFFAEPYAQTLGTDRELFGLRKDGTEFPIELGVNPLKTDEGTMVLATVSDITDRKRAEEALRNSQEQLAGIINSAMDAIITVDAGQKILLFNSAAEKMFRIDAASAMGKPLDTFIPPRYREHHASHVEGFGETQTTRRAMGSLGALFALRTDGEEFPIEASISQIESVGKKLYTVILRDITERLKAESAIRENENRLRAVTENLTEGLVIASMEGQLLHWNRAGLKMFGFDSLDDVLKKVGDFTDTFELLELDGTPIAPENWPLNSVLRGERVRDREVIVRRRDMYWQRTLRYSGSIVLAASNEPLGYLAIADVTERKAAESALRQSEDRFRTIANSMSQLAWVAHSDGQIFWYNDRWYEYTGKTPKEMEGSGWQTVHDPDVLPDVLLRWHLAIDSGTPFEMEFPLRGKDDVYRSFLTRVEPLKDRDGRVVQWFGTNTDVDDLKRLAASLSETQSRLNSTLSAGSIGTWMWDLANDNLVADEFIARSFSIDPDAAAVGRPAADYIKAMLPEDQPRVQAALAEAIETCGNYDIEYRVRTLDGAIIWLKARGRVEGDENGEGRFFHGAAMDITDRKNAEETVFKLNEQLETRVLERTTELQTVNKELEAFSYSVSHDLRAPLRHIDGFVQLLTKREADKLDATSSRYLNVVTKAVEKMGSLIDELLAFSRTTRQEIKISRVDLNLLVHEAMTILADTYVDRRITWNIENLPTVLGDPTLLNVVITNLISNAIKYTRPREDAVIEIGVAEDTEAQITIFFRDNGAGFDMEYADKLFGVFQRLHREEEFEGIGIGLATVQRIVNRHGGSVRAEGAVDQGATFYITLNKEVAVQNEY